jgi:DNA polymerase elongation subunit (family B)
MEFNIGEHRDFCIASDTDSAFFTAEPLLIKKYGDLSLISREELIEETKQIAESKTESLNEYLDGLALELFNIKKNQISFKNESIIQTAYWSGKRRYAQYIVNKEGVPVEELDMKGLDLMKSNFPPLFKNFGEHILKEIMFGKSKESIDKQVLEFKNSLKTIEWQKILKPTGLKTLKKYIDSKPGSGEIFSKIGLKCPINTKAAIYTNDILRFKKLDKKYPIFQIGDKINIAYLKENPYKIDVIALNGYSDAPEILEIAEKYIDREGLFEGVLKNKIENLYSDLGWGAPVFNPKVFQFFKF